MAEAVLFRAHPQQVFGFDNFRYRANIKQFDELKMADGTYPIPFKSLEDGQSDKVLVVLPPTESLDSTKTDKTFVRFFDGDNHRLMPSDLSQAADSTYATITVPAGCRKVKATTIRTIEGKQREVVLGQLNCQRFQSQTRNVILVSVNKASLSLSNSEIETALNNIYASAVSKWKVSSDLKEITIADVTIVDDGDNELCSKYTGDMKTLIQAYKDAFGDLPDDNTVCLFLCADAKSGSKQGYMPLKGRFGFLFTGQLTDAATTKRTAAHELAHGTFRLWHTFSTENKYIFAERTTNNLMDYNEGSELYKYQWDFVHDPESMWFAWTQDEAEGAAIVKDSYSVLSNAGITPGGYPFKNAVCINKDKFIVVQLINKDKPWVVTGFKVYKKVSEKDPKQYDTSNLVKTYYAKMSGANDKDGAGNTLARNTFLGYFYSDKSAKEYSLLSDKSESGITLYYNETGTENARVYKHKDECSYYIYEIVWTNPSVKSENNKTITWPDYDVIKGKIEGASKISRGLYYFASKNALNCKAESFFAQDERCKDSDNQESAQQIKKLSQLSQDKQAAIGMIVGTVNGSCKSELSKLTTSDKLALFKTISASDLNYDEQIALLRVFESLSTTDKDAFKSALQADKNAQLNKIVNALDRVSLPFNESPFTIFSKLLVLKYSASEDQEFLKTALQLTSSKEGFFTKIALNEVATNLLPQYNVVKQMYDKYKLFKSLIEIVSTCNDYNQLTMPADGLVPECVWKGASIETSQYYSSTDIPAQAGRIDALYSNLKSIYDIAKFLYLSSRKLDCQTSKLAFYLLPDDAITNELIKGTALFSNKGNYYSQYPDCESVDKEWAEVETALESVAKVLSDSKQFNQALYNMTEGAMEYFVKSYDLTNQARYNQSRVAVNIALMFVGVGEIKAALKATETGVKVAQALENAGASLKKYLNIIARLSCSVSDASKVKFGHSDEFIDIILHKADDGYQAIIEIPGQTSKTIGAAELAKYMDDLPESSKTFRLLSCNSAQDAQELSRLTSKKFYASDGAVDLYPNGTIRSENPFRLYENGVASDNGLKYGDLEDISALADDAKPIRLGTANRAGNNLTKIFEKFPNLKVVFDKIPSSVQNDFSNLSESTFKKMLTSLDENPELLQAVNENPDISKLWTKHKNKFSEQELETANNTVVDAAKNYSETLKKQIWELADESGMKTVMIERFEKGVELGKTVSNQLRNRLEAYQKLKAEFAAAGKNLDDYTIYEQVQLCIQGDCISEGNYWIPDFVAVVRKYDDAANEYYLETIIVDSKLSRGTGWTGNQKEAKKLLGWKIKTDPSKPFFNGNKIEGFSSGAKLNNDGSFIKIFSENGIVNIER